MPAVSPRRSSGGGATIGAVAAAVAVAATTARADVAGAGEPPWAWAAEARSPVSVASDPAAAISPRDAALVARCGAADAGLAAVARRLVERKLRGLPYLDVDGLSFAQRVAGEPHVWPRAWIVSGSGLDPATLEKRLDTWRASFHDIGQRRCGLASAIAADGTEVIAALALDALADLAPLATRVHVGRWLEVDATMMVPATGAHVVVLGPTGTPRTVPTSFDGTHVRARFAPDRSGAFTVQVMADVTTGPRPVLEAQIFADVEPPTTTPNLAAPGEDAAAGGTDGAALVRMVQAVRAAENLAPLARDARLDAVALAHARRMMSARTVGHDVGDGDPAARLEAAGLRAREAGENVAHAPTLPLAHRSLYASPSHRSNLLRSGYDRIGVAVVPDADRSVWVVEVFAANAD